MNGNIYHSLIRLFNPLISSKTLITSHWWKQAFSQASPRGENKIFAPSVWNTDSLAIGEISKVAEASKKCWLLTISLVSISTLWVLDKAWFTQRFTHLCFSVLHVLLMARSAWHQFPSTVWWISGSFHHM